MKTILNNSTKDLAILNKDFGAIKSVLEFLEKIKMNIGIVNADPDSLSADNEDGKVIRNENIVLISLGN